ncbi:hypothetical protein CI109_103632 [Kwoniella shandongensis]|uniref:Uncharacterized protein n=1 Tax=Kwoniella shandongensis TaxID=1734106 RepID=A0A5M6C7R7_9TREE|nr:uncharacterized protein CI109_000676 [Kwoniella shandongensis]KAA5531104.1 hypothetical protein CI109_000676 [Kwoniella shandongensis]
MLWRFSFASSSALDILLTRETPPSLEELMDEQDILSECKAQNNKLVAYLSREDPIKSLLHWVVAGLDELDQQAAIADRESLNQALSSSSDLYPSYRHGVGNVPSLHFGSNVEGGSSQIPGTGPGSPPLEPSKLVDVEIHEVREGEDRKEEEEEHENGLGVGVGLGQGLRRKSDGEEDLHRSRYPSIATEILCCVELWSIADTIMRNPEQLLTPFWDAVLPPLDPTTPTTETSSTTLSRHEAGERERARNEFWSDEDEERDRRREMIRGMWMRVNGTLMTKRTTEMVRFIQSLPNIVERIVARIASPAVQDILIRIVSSEEGGVTGVIDWLADEGLIPKLIELLSPHHSTATHIVAAEVLKSIITLCAPTPFNPHGGNAMEQQAGQGVQPPGTRDNRLIRELISETSVNTMIGFMLDDIELTDNEWKGLNSESEGGDSGPSPADPFVVHPLPSVASATSSLSHVCNILVEVIRRNNSDFSEPHLFHTLRNRLMGVRMQPNENGGQESNAATEEGKDVPPETEQEREEKERRHMEEALVDMSSKMGIVHLGHLLDVISDKFGALHKFVLQPRSQDRAASSLNPKPFTLERFRIVELYAELLHSSNMSILNRVPGTGPTYTEEGILSGGLEGLEALGEAIDGDHIGEDDGQVEEDQVTQARELPVSSGSTDVSLTGSDDVASDDEEMLETIDDDATPSPSPAASATLDPPPVHVEAPTPPPPSQENAERLRDVMGIESKPPTSSAASEVASSISHVAVANSTAAPSIVSDVAEPEQDETSRPPVLGVPIGDSSLAVLAPGDKLKQRYLDHDVIPTVVNLFFEYPNNDFMHHVVYDILQQILNGRLGPGLNRELVVELLSKAKLVERILDAQRLNDRLIAQPKTPRLAYMGHIILIAEELVKFFTRCPPELFELIKDSFVLSEWEAFVDSSLREAKARDSRPLAGGKPMGPGSGPGDDGMGLGGSGAGGREEDSSDEEDEDGEQVVKFGEPLTRTVAADGFAPRGEFDAYADHEREGDEDEEGMDRFWKSAGVGLNRRPVDSSDDDDDDADWLRPSVNSGWTGTGNDDDDFGGWENGGSSRQAGRDEFEDDEGWGNFNTATSPPRSPDPNAENPFGDDNFAPSVVRSEPIRESQGEPLTPLDWAEQFDRAFRENGGDEPAQTAEGVPAIVMPTLEDDDDDGEERAMGMSMSTGTSSWTFEGDDDGVDLPPTMSPTLTDEGFPMGNPLDLPRPPSKSSKSEKEELTSPQKERSSSISSESSSATITESTSKPIPIPHRQSSAGHRPRPGHPATSSASDDETLSLSLSPSRSSASSSRSPGSHEHRWGEAFSPPDPALIAAATEESPLGPGVSPDTHITREGMLEREVDGEMVRVPQDEIVEAIERRADDDESEGEGQ